MLFFLSFFVFTFLKTVLLCTLLYNDLSYDPLVLFLLVGCPISVVFLFWREHHNSKKYESRLNIGNIVFYLIRGISIFITGILWEHHSYRGAIFADMFLAISLLDLCIAIAGGILPKTYEKLDEMYKNRHEIKVKD